MPHPPRSQQFRALLLELQHDLPGTEPAGSCRPGSSRPACKSDRRTLWSGVERSSQSGACVPGKRGVSISIK
jgi:hypothetical protein